MTRYEKGDRNSKDERLTETASINSMKKYDYNKPIDLIYTLMWIEELIPNYYISFSDVPNINELYIVTIKKFYNEWNIMRNKRFKREISYKEYIKRKLNYDLKEVGGFLSKYIINQDIDESISQGTYNASKSIENIGSLLSIESCIDKTTKSTLLPNNIIVIGNSCAGKTTFIDYFKKYYNIYSDIDDLEPLLETFMLDDLLYQNKIEEFKKIKNELKYVNKIWEEYNDNINSINHYTKPANLGNGHDIIRPILWDYIIQMAIVNPETHNIIQFSRGKDELYESQFSQNAYFRSIKNFIDNSENNSNSIIVNLVSSLKIRKNRNRIRFENGGHYVSDDTMDNVYSKDIFEYTKTGENFGYLLVDGRTIPVYTIVNDKTLSEIELNKFLEYNVNKVIEYYNDFKEEKHGIKKDSKRYLAKQIK